MQLGTKLTRLTSYMHIELTHVFSFSFFFFFNYIFLLFLIWFFFTATSCPMRHLVVTSYHEQSWLSNNNHCTTIWKGGYGPQLVEVKIWTSIWDWLSPSMEVQMWTSTMAMAVVRKQRLSLLWGSHRLSRQTIGGCKFYFNFLKKKTHINIVCI